MDIQNPSPNGKKCLNFLGWLAVGLAGLLAVWIVGGNFIASQQEKEIERDLAAFVRRFPKTEPNDSALKLAALMAQLGFSTSVTKYLSPVARYMRSSDDFTASEDERKVLEDIREELGNYLDTQIAKPNDAIAPPSEKLQRYLASKQTALAEIRQHVLTHEVPHWGTDITGIAEGDMTVVLPSYLRWVDFHKILALDILEKYRQGQTEAAAEMLEVSWKTTQSLTESPLFIAQLVALIVERYQAGVMRKVDSLPTKWQQRLRERNYRESILPSLRGEGLLIFNFWQHFIWKHSLSSIEEELDVSNLIELHRVSDSPTVQEAMSGWALSKIIVWFKPAIKPYIRFSAINTYQLYQRTLSASRQLNVCFSNSVKIEDFAWWNSLGWVFDSRELFDQSRTAASMLDLELTQKILQVKALAASEGQWPPSVPDMESSICPGAKWVYRVAPDGTMSVSFSEKPEWLEERLEKGMLPFTYSDKTPPQRQNPAATPQKR